MILKLQKNTKNVFNEDIPLITTSSGHYPIPITEANQMINNLNQVTEMPITLTVSNENEQSQDCPIVAQTVCRTSSGQVTPSTI